ncbi:PREDICTED: WAP four-disulfide core domain protein 13 [Miniopterus natalensis]|uniref:WAP four-disulfide core domain protein 13 n=1 Tax=Miniopterus natalensis TaxID=291302 RepID=UPI0007A7120E|nr:PREDICTED: WAP four-disulfide core domain protein 13 [Miniopterus natalensis]
MKPVLPLQLLLLIHLAPQLVPGSPKHRFIKYILEPPPCKVSPENCTQFCTLQEHCPKQLQCCSAFCGITCTLNKYTAKERLSSAERLPSTDHYCSGDPGVAEKIEEGDASEVLRKMLILFPESAVLSIL